MSSRRNAMFSLALSVLLGWHTVAVGEMNFQILRQSEGRAFLIGSGDLGNRIPPAATNMHLMTLEDNPFGTPALPDDGTLQAKSTLRFGTDGAWVDIRFVNRGQIPRSEYSNGEPFMYFGSTPADRFRRQSTVVGVIDLRLDSGLTIGPVGKTGDVLWGIPGTFGSTSKVGTWTINALTAQHLLENSVQILVGTEFETFRASQLPAKPADRTGLGAMFRPNLGVSLDDAAAFLGYDHFNWLQIVTEDTAADALSDDALVEAGTGDRFGNPIRAPFVDPYSGGYGGLACLRGIIDCSPMPARADFTFPPFRDELPGFLDEQYTDDGILATVDNGLLTKLQEFSRDLDSNGANETLLFSDQPWTSTGESIRFETYLIGVFGDGNTDKLGEILDLSGLNFTWEFHGDEEGGVVSVLEDGGITAATGGKITFNGFIAPGSITEQRLHLFNSLGISVKSPSPVPIPPSLWLCGTSTLIIFRLRRTSRRSRGSGFD